MYRRTLTPVINRAFATAMLNAGGTRPAAALLTTPKIELFSNNITPTPDTPWASFTAIAFTGYAQYAWVPEAVGNVGADIGLPGSSHFAATATPSPSVTALGYILSDGAAVVYMAELFAQPVPFVLSGDYLDLDVIIPFILKPLFNTLP